MIYSVEIVFIFALFFWILFHFFKHQVSMFQKFWHILTKRFVSCSLCRPLVNVFCQTFATILWRSIISEKCRYGVNYFVLYLFFKHNTIIDWDSMDRIKTRKRGRAFDFFSETLIECLKNLFECSKDSSTCFETNLIDGHIKNFWNFGL